MFLGLGLGVALGALAGVLITYLRLNKNFAATQSDLVSQKNSLEQKLAGVEAEKESLNVRLQEHKKDIQEIKEKIVLEITQAQHKSVQESSEHLHKVSRQNLETLLNPFQSQLKDLQERIHKTYDVESRERISLQEQIKMMAQVHEKMTFETSSLTKALRGDAKTQGDWGEITLRRLLEASGLREGHEYTEQGKGLGFRDEDGVLRKPDFLVRLPEGRNLIIDSKVVLTSYESFCRAEAPELKQQFQKEFIAGVLRHIEDLASKDYASLHSINAPDFTMMFLPTDGAYLLATQCDEQLHIKAGKQKVMLASPSLLLPTLKTVEFMWKQDKQSKNAEKIADAAGKLYDKFVGFVEDLELVKTQLQNSEKSLDAAFDKLKSGNGNLVRQTERLKDLGARAKKQISSKWIEEEKDTEVEI